MGLVLQFVSTSDAIIKRDWLFVDFYTLCFEGSFKVAVWVVDHFFFEDFEEIFSNPSFFWNQICMSRSRGRQFEIGFFCGEDAHGEEEEEEERVDSGGFGRTSTAGFFPGGASSGVSSSLFLFNIGKRYKAEKNHFGGQQKLAANFRQIAAVCLKMLFFATFCHSANSPQTRRKGAGNGGLLTCQSLFFLFLFQLPLIPDGLLPKKNLGKYQNRGSHKL